MSIFISGHHPPKGEAYEGWLHNYIRIVDRFQHLITAAYNGHTHKDELAVLYNQEQKPVGIHYVSGSLTTYSYLNPSYKIVQVDQKVWSWIIPLTVSPTISLRANHWTTIPTTWTWTD